MAVGEGVSEHLPHMQALRLYPFVLLGVIALVYLLFVPARPDTQRWVVGNSRRTQARLELDQEDLVPYRSGISGRTGSVAPELQMSLAEWSYCKAPLRSAD